MEILNYPIILLVSLKKLIRKRCAFNLSSFIENPYDAADKFLMKHDLPQSFREEVATFIIKNTNAVDLGVGQYQDPFTGGGRYVPNSNQGAAGGTGYLDPFTGQGSYRPGQSTTQPSSSVNYGDPFTSANSYKQSNVVSKVFPIVS